MNTTIKIKAALIPARIKDCFIGDSVKTGLDLFVIDKATSKVRGIFTAAADDQYYTNILIQGIHNKELFIVSSNSNEQKNAIIELKKAELFDLIISENFLIENKIFFIRNGDIVDGPFSCIDYKLRGQRLKNVERMKQQINAGRIYVPVKSINSIKE